MTNNVSVKKYENFNREKALANFRQKTADIAARNLPDPIEKQATNSAERISCEKEK